MQVGVAEDVDKVLAHTFLLALIRGFESIPVDVSGVEISTEDDSSLWMFLRELG